MCETFQAQVKAANIRHTRKRTLYSTASLADTLCISFVPHSPAVTLSLMDVTRPAMSPDWPRCLNKTLCVYLSVCVSACVCVHSTVCV